MTYDTWPAEGPEWSVMIPTYHCAGYLEQALLSVLAQDPGPGQMQIEVVDDHSTLDDPAGVVARLGRGRVGFHRQAANVGHTRNFDTCIARARGRLVHILHGDDRVRPGFYARMAALLAARPEAGAAFCRHLHMDHDGQWGNLSPLQEQTSGLLVDALPRIASYKFVHTSSMVVRRGVYGRVGGFDHRLGYGEDWEMWVRIAARFPIAYETQPLAEIRQHDASLSESMFLANQAAQHLFRAIDIFAFHLREAGQLTQQQLRTIRKTASNDVSQFTLHHTADLFKSGRRSLSALKQSWAAVWTNRSLQPKRWATGYFFRYLGAYFAEDTPAAPPPPCTAETDGEGPEWSVMIPTYHCAGYLEQALLSVLAQDPGPGQMQIEVVDDHSTLDDPAGVVARLGRGRVGFHRQAANVGHTRNFDTCIARARGRLVHILHGDDRVRPGFYARMAALLAARPEAGAAFCRHLHMDHDGQWRDISELQEQEPGLLSNALIRLARNQIVQPPSMVVRRGVYGRVGGFDHRLGYGEDWEMWVRIAARFPIAYETQPLAEYRKLHTSITGHFSRSGADIRSTLQVIKMLGGYLPPAHRRYAKRYARRAFSYYHRSLAWTFYRKNDLQAAKAQWLGVVKLYPNVPFVLSMLPMGMRIYKQYALRLFRPKPSLPLPPPTRLEKHGAAL